ncbi:fungal protein [Schizosaccharomyces japonicus yFS275]|uniref:Fungal protein n=1 Tax=Schizosaccharomyces japonicus (strain yFS275 / FY16936) TaxID=402676 RepID=B6K612_SCHJY|nr:fungal protein [Schizosaccharomyces japonicus yFS275]EEB08966.1 fungal protein [Schizosaccharomyces japonicus yFS275]
MTSLNYSDFSIEEGEIFEDRLPWNDFKIITPPISNSEEGSSSIHNDLIESDGEPPVQRVQLSSEHFEDDERKYYQTHKFILRFHETSVYREFYEDEDSDLLNSIQQQTGVRLKPSEDYSTIYIYATEHQYGELAYKALTLYEELVNSKRDVQPEKQKKNTAEADWVRKSRTVFPILEHMSIQQTEQYTRVLRHFLKEPDPSFSFAVEGTYIWPFQGLKIRDVMGPNLDRFNDIRVGCHCYIGLLDSQTDTVVIVKGKQQEQVEQALQEIEALCLSFAASQRLLKKTSIHICHLDKETFHCYVYLNDKHPLQLQLLKQNVKIGIPLGVVPHKMVEPSVLSTSITELNLKNEAIIANHLKFSLLNIFAFHGLLQMRVQLGIPFFSRIKRFREEPAVKISELIKDERIQSAFCSYVFPTLNIQALYDSLQEVDFTSLDIPFEEKEMSSILRAHFFLQHNAKTFEVVAEWTKSKGSPSIWYNDSKKKTASELTHVNLRNISWKMGIKYGKEGTIPKEINDFMINVHLSPTGEVFFFCGINSPKVTNIVFEKVRQFWFLPSKDSISFCFKKVWSANTDMNTIVHRVDITNIEFTGYDIFFWNPKWDILLKENKDIQAGKLPTYRPCLEEFFPESLPKFLQKMDTLVHCLEALKKHVNNRSNHS